VVATHHCSNYQNKNRLVGLAVFPIFNLHFFYKYRGSNKIVPFG
jgi:hypothetical protein